jgi:hypothetical protein
MKLLLFTCLLLPMPLPSRDYAARCPEESVLLESPVRVSACGNEPGVPEMVCMRVGGKFEYSAMFGSFQEEARPKLQPPYLFVPFSCGGGNMWRCRGYEAFKLKRGKLRYLGALSTWGKEPVQDGIFLDGYARLEMSRLLCHACSPGFQIALRDVDDRLRLDREMTRKINEEKIEEKKRAFMEAAAASSELYSSGLFLAAIYKLVGDEEGLQGVRARFGRLDQEMKGSVEEGNPFVNLLDELDEALKRVSPTDVVERHKL